MHYAVLLAQFSDHKNCLNPKELLLTNPQKNLLEQSLKSRLR